MGGLVRLPRARAERRLRDLGKRGIRRSFELGQRAGINVLPHHFYSSVPDLRSLARSTAWKQPHTLIGVRGGDDVDAQLAVLRMWMADGPPEPTWPDACGEHGEPGYGPVESDVLYAFVRSQRPGRIVQVGAGVSTAVILRAARDANYKPKIVCIDPFPTGYLVESSARGEVKLVAEPAQTVDLEVLLAVGNGDLLFVDSTHTVKPGSEVNRLIFEVLPRLPSGAWVHFHDITFPYDYGRGLLTQDLFFWGESTLVLAFLVGNERFAVGVSMSVLHYERPAELQVLLHHYTPQANDEGLRLSADGHFPSSLYLRTVT